MKKLKHKDGKYLTTDGVYQRLRECLAAVEPSDKKLSGAMRTRLDYNLYFLRTFIELQEGKGTDVQAIGFSIESEQDEEYDTDEEQEEGSAEQNSTRKGKRQEAKK